MNVTDYRSVGFIGLGTMGFPMVQNLARKLPDTTKVIVYDLNTEAMETLVTEIPNKIVKGKNPQDVFSQSNVVITMLPEGKHVRSVYMASEPPLKAADLRDKVLIDSSTIDVETSLAIKDYVTQIEPSASFYDAPVSGGPEGATEGVLAFFIGIDENDKNFAVVQDITMLMGDKDKIIPCGKVSCGLVAKISHNYLGGVMNVLCCETMNLGIRAGLDPRLLYRVLVAGRAKNGIIEKDNCVPGVVPTAPSSNGYKPGFRASLMHKDMSLALQMAESYNSDLVLGPQALSLYKQALREFGDLDFTVLYKLIAHKQ